MAAILGPGDHPQQHILPQMVRGTYFGGTICGMTAHICLMKECVIYSFKPVFLVLLGVC